VAIGVRPNLGLVEDLAIEKDKGVLVNDFLQSSQPSLFAAGDVAQVYDRWTGQHQLDILWPSAINEGRAAGINMVDIAHGQSPSFNYRKGSPFNCALLFGLHLTVIGRVGTKANGDVDQLQYLSRGSSNVWTAPFTTRFRSAWDKDGLNSLRIVMAEGQIVGALLIGNQELADPLRRFIEQEVDLSNYEAQLTAGHAKLPQTLLQAWRVWNQRWS
jgi:NADPH-dependent 2,4-dienoyl-CoA reductase/sulfur reductase-like enzyme